MTRIENQRTNIIKKIRFVVYASRTYLQYDDYNLYAIVKAGAITIE